MKPNTKEWLNELIVTKLIDMIENHDITNSQSNKYDSIGLLIKLINEKNNLTKENKWTYLTQLAV